MKTRLWIVTGVVLAVLMVLAVLLKTVPAQVKHLSYLGDVPEFNLLDADGKVFSSDKLRDKVWIADFFVTDCQEICPLKSQNMAKLSRTFERVKDVAFVSFSLDAGRSTAAQIQDYARKLQGKRNWSFLTGEQALIEHLAGDSFKLIDKSHPEIHADYLVLVGRNMHIRGYYEGTNARRLNELFQDMAYLVENPEQ